ncbi:MAG: tetratricopeptide repeat protein [Bacteroidota bacterium]|jgi:tetratricopeptide (TPR) repeat protein
MFDDEEDDFHESSLNEDLERFEGYLKGGSLGFMDSDRLEALIDHYLINSQYTKAKACAEHAIDQFSYNQLFHLRKAQAISAMGQLKEALRILTQIEKIESPSMEFLLTKASIFSQIKDSKNAIKFFREALQLSEPEDRDEIYIDLAMEYENMNDYRGAVQVLKEAIKSNPHNEGAIYEIAFCYDQLGEYSSAIQCYSDYIDENPYSFTAWYNLGNAYSKVENYEKAIWAYDYCILINEEFGPVHFNLGNAYLSQEKYLLAIESFHKCMEIDGDDPMALCYIGEAHEQLNELELARHFYRRSVELAPMLPDAWLGLGIIEDLEGRTKEALVLIHKAAELDPENAGIYHVLAGAYEKLEDLEQAEEFYQLSLTLDPSDEECLTNYIELISERSLPEALDCITDFIENIGGNKLATVLKVDVLWKLGRKEESISAFATCVSQNRKKAKELFQINPSLLNVEEFIHLADE